MPPKRYSNVWLTPMTPSTMPSKSPHPPQPNMSPAVPSPGTPAMASTQSPVPSPVPPPVPHATRPTMNRPQQAPQPPQPPQPQPQYSMPSPMAPPTAHQVPQQMPQQTQRVPQMPGQTYPQMPPQMHHQVPNYIPQHNQVQHAPRPPQMPLPGGPATAPQGPSTTGSVFEAGMIFPSIQEAREALLTHTVAAHESYRVYKSDARRYMTRCRSRDCDYMVRITWRKKRCEAYVSIYKPHTCSPDTHDNWRPAASINYLVPNYQSLFEGNTKPTAAQIQAIEQYKGNTIHYHQGYRTLKAIERNLYGDESESFQKLPAFLSRLAKTDYSGFWRLETKDDVFQRCFIAPGATINAYEHCRQFLTVDRAPWKTKWDFSLLVAATMDGNNQVLPIAWAVMPGETEDDWRWFLNSLLRAFPKIHDPSTVLMCDPRLPIEAAMQKELPAVSHIHCCEHLSQMLMDKFRPAEEVRKQFWKAARAESEAKFEQAVTQIRDDKARRWIQSIPPAKWAKFAIPAPRYDQLTSTLLDSLNFLWLNTRNMPILRSLYFIWLNITDRFHQCREYKFKRSSSTLTDFAQDYITRQKQLSRTFHAVASSQDQFTVFKNAMGYVVDIPTGTCSCFEWQDLKLPCRHALAAISSTSRSINEFVHDIYSIDTYKAIYSSVLMPVDMRDLDKGDQCIAPEMRKRRGRKPKNPPQQSTEQGNASGTQSHCSVCRQEGHSGQSDICPGNMKARGIVAHQIGDGIRLLEHLPGEAPLPMAEPTTAAAPKNGNEDLSTSMNGNGENDNDSNSSGDEATPEPDFAVIPPLPEWDRMSYQSLSSPPTDKEAEETQAPDFPPPPEDPAGRREWALDAKRRLDAVKQYITAEEQSRLQGQILDVLLQDDY
ncbi:hypothetical protein AWENTII_013014 [Aspergillus wentii]